MGQDTGEEKMTIQGVALRGRNFINNTEHTREKHKIKGTTRGQNQTGRIKYEPRREWNHQWMQLRTSMRQEVGADLQTCRKTNTMADWQTEQGQALKHTDHKY